MWERDESRSALGLGVRPKRRIVFAAGSAREDWAGGPIGRGRDLVEINWGLMQMGRGGVVIEVARGPRADEQAECRFVNLDLCPDRAIWIWDGAI